MLLSNDFTKLFFILLLGSSKVLAHPPCNASTFLTVHTSNGPVTGHLTSDSSCVVEYLGVPYAKAPVGNLRFAPPQRFNDTRPYEAANFGFDCPLTPSPRVNYPDMTPQAQRIISYFASGAGTPQSEDCLTLNIWSGATRNAAIAKKPVLVFFYGGRATVGNTNSPLYNGKYFAAANDAIIITVNYRVNIFGFPGAPGEMQNLGLRDQRVAVEWIRDNISGFGGDSTKITIAGQSSGGVAVDYWTYAYAQDPIINGVIATSGNALSFPVNSPGIPEKNWNTVVNALGCNNTDKVVACMREAKWEDIKKAAATVRPLSSSSVLRSIPPFYPTPDNDTVFLDYVGLTKAGKFARVPVLFGNNNNEDGFYRIPAYGNGVVPTDDQVRIFDLESFTCPVSFQVDARRDYGVPAWAYRYLADWDNTRLYPTSGAYHGVDLHMIFGASEDVSGLPTSEDQNKLVGVMQEAWFSFSNDPKRGLKRLGWPEFTRDGKSLAVIGRNNEPRVRFVKPSEFDAQCAEVKMGGQVM